MWFWWFMLACSMLIPLTMIVGGIAMDKRSPKRISSVYGYRTPRSMKNMDTWQFAHRYCGRLWLIVGALITAPSVLALIPFIGKSDDVISVVAVVILVVQTVAMMIPLIPTEAALKRTFDENGNRK